MPPDFVLFIDENHCNNRRVLSVLQERGVAYERYLDHFQRGMADSEWLPIIGQRGWALLTTDRRIRYHNIEKQAVRENNVQMFCFSTNKMNGQEMAEALDKGLAKILQIAEQTPPPFIAMITSGSK
ncbi:MAG: hypothetical protein ACP5M4_12270 [Acidobacteriaceae bacterium]